VTGDSIKEIVYEIERLRKEAPSAQEMEAVRKNGPSNWGREIW
jgi:hypothetical protein